MLYRIFQIIFLTLAAFSQAAVEVQGVPDPIKKNILNRLEYKINLNSVELNQHTSDQLELETKSAIRPFGYFNSAVTTYFEKDTIYIDVKLNEISKFSEINIHLQQEHIDLNLQQNLEKATLKYLNKPFSINNISDLMYDLKVFSNTSGYYDAVITRGTTSVNRYTSLGNIEILVTPKEKSLFGELVFPENVNPSCFSRYHSIIPGQHFQISQVSELHKNLRHSGLFESSNIKTVPRNDAPHIQDVYIELVPEKTIKFFAGLGLRANWNDHKVAPQVYFKMKFNNLDNCGLTLSNTLKFSTEGNILDSDLVFPVSSGIDDFNLLSIQSHSNDVQNNDASAYVQALFLAQRRIFSLIHQLSINYLTEKSSIDNTDIDSEDAYSTKLIFPKYQVKADFSQPNSSISLKTKILGSLESFASDLSFLQITSTLSLQNRPSILLLDGQLSFGKTITEKFNQFPLSMQFYLGGPGSLRGLSYQELNQGKTFGLLRTSAQIRVMPSIYTGFFFDNGYCDQDDTETTQYYPSAGFIATYSTSYGKLDLSIGKQIDGSTWVILFNAEPDME